MLYANKIIRPLVQLGLAPDMGFARKMLSSLDPRSSIEKDKSDIRVTLQDFNKVLKKSKVSDHLQELIIKES